MKLEFSAGGVVLKKSNNTLYVLVAKHAQHHGWVFPKGLMGDREDNKHEGKEETAIREVEEETGIKAEILTPLTEISYWYQFEGEKRKKTVYYFIMKHLSGDFTKRDHEMEDVKWIEHEKVADKLTYPSDKKVWQEAKIMISKFRNEI